MILHFTNLFVTFISRRILVSPKMKASTNNKFQERRIFHWTENLVVKGENVGLLSYQHFPFSQFSQKPSPSVHWSKSIIMDQLRTYNNKTRPFHPFPNMPFFLCLWHKSFLKHCGKRRKSKCSCSQCFLPF